MLGLRACGATPAFGTRTLIMSLMMALGEGGRTGECPRRPMPRRPRSALEGREGVNRHWSATPRQTWERAVGGNNATQELRPRMDPG